jgi:hypothetical protein
MQKLIRHGVFETNSSSSHSISISHDVSKYQTLFPDEAGVYEFNGGEFGWGYDSYTDADTKANYVATMSMELGEGRGDECDDGSTPLRDLLESVITEHTGITKFEYSLKYAYIDHQSVDLGMLKWTPQEMKDFIFNPRSELDIDNDNR